MDKHGIRIFIILMLFAGICISGCGGGDSKDGTENTKPEVVITGVTGTHYDIEVSYTLTDADSDFCNIMVEYSLNGVDFITATSAASGDGIFLLNSSPGGTAHTFVWDSLSDFDTSETGVVIRIVPDDSYSSGTGDTSSPSFDVDNTPDEALVDVVDPGDIKSGDFLISYSFTAGDSYEYDVILYYSEDSGITFAQGTPGDGGSGTTVSGPGSYTYMWDSIADIGNSIQDDIQVRIKVYDKTEEKYSTPNVNDTTADFSVDNALSSVVATINTGFEPFRIAVTPNSDKVFVVNFKGESVTVIDALNDSVITTLGMPCVPFDVVVKGGYAYVSCFDETGSGAADSVEVINTSTYAIDYSISLTNCYPQGIAVDPVGDYVYVACKKFENRGIKIIETENHTVYGSVDISIDHSNINGIAVTPDGSYIFITDQSANNITKVRTSNYSIVNTLTFYAGSPANSYMWDIVIAPDGVLAYAADRMDPVHRINTAANTKATPDEIAVQYSLSIDITPDGRLLYITYPGLGDQFDPDGSDPLEIDGGTLYIVETATDTTIDTIPTWNPQGVTVAPDGKRVYVSDVIEDVVKVISY